jgi:pre-rRNA-processing protein TSR3
VQGRVRIVVYNAKQDDPRKCTAAKLRRFGLVREVLQTRFLPKRAIVLNPFSEVALSPADRGRIEKFGLVGFDCSWELAEKVLLKNVKGTSRCLPVLIVGNPVNFGKATRLSTVEALAAALYIVGFEQEAKRLLSLFKWGHTFLDLNHERLECYKNARDSSEVVELQKRFLKDLERQQKGISACS